MYPHERSLVKHYKDRPFALIGVNSDPKSKLAEVKKTKNLSWRSFAAGRGGGQIAKDWKIRGWPTIYLIDDRGLIRVMNVRGEALEREIERLVQEAEKRQSSNP